MIKMLHTTLVFGLLGVTVTGCHVPQRTVCDQAFENYDVNRATNSVSEKDAVAFEQCVITIRNDLKR